VAHLRTHSTGPDAEFSSSQTRDLRSFPPFGAGLTVVTEARKKLSADIAGEWKKRGKSSTLRLLRQVPSEDILSKGVRATTSFYNLGRSAFKGEVVSILRSLEVEKARVSSKGKENEPYGDNLDLHLTHSR